MILDDAVPALERVAGWAPNARPCCSFAVDVAWQLGATGDAEHFAACIAAARGRCTHPAMAAWLPRLDALETRAADTF